MSAIANKKKKGKDFFQFPSWLSEERKVATIIIIIIALTGQTFSIRPYALTLNIEA